MATFYNSNCTECNFFFSASGCRHFQKNETVRMQQYAHPILLSEQSRGQDIYGFCGDLYCPNCHETFDFYLVEFEQTYPDFASAWRQIIMKEMDEDVMLCPRCGFKNLELV